MNDETESGLTSQPIAQWLSLLVASVSGLVLSIFPQFVMHGSQAPDHTVLMLFLWGLTAGFVHGVGFIPRNLLFRTLLGPSVAWTMMPLGLYLIWARP